MTFLPVIFLVILTTINNTMSVNGDATLVSGVCSKTLNPVDCHNCFDSNPRSSQIDLRGLTGIAINCSSSQAIVMSQVFYKLYTYELDLSYKSQYAACLEKFDYIMQTLSLALQSWRNIEYQDSINQVKKALNDFRECLMDLTKPSSPPQLIEELWKTKAFYENSIGIIMQIRS